MGNIKDCLNNARGALIGLAIGDALGATTEFMSPEEIKSKHGVVRDIIGGGWLHLKPGEVTDDTEMTLCVARSLKERGGFDAKDMADKCVEWLKSDPKDVGNATDWGLRRYMETGEIEAPPSERAGGNGALMRVAPFAFLEQGIEHAIQHAHLTHNHPESDKAIVEYLTMVKAALQGVLEKPCPVEWKGGAGGYVVDTWNTVLHCFTTTDTFEEALIKCVNLGDDADTTGAILGGLAGAYYELSAVPERWLKALDQQVRSEAEKLADEISTLQAAL